MAIVMKYGAPGPVLQAAYAAGVGSRANKEKDDALKLWQQQNQQQFQAQQSWLDRAQRAGMQQQAFAQQSQLQNDAFAQQNKYAEDQRTFQTQRDEAEMGFRSTQAGRVRQWNADQSAAEALRREQSALAQRNAELIRKGEAVLPPAVQAELDKLRGGVTEALKMDPDKQDQFFNKPGTGFYDQERRLLGMATPVPGKSDADLLEEKKQMLPEAERGKPLVLNSKKELTLLPGWKPDTSVADAQKKEQADLAEIYKRIRTTPNDKNQLPDPEVAAEEARKEYAIVQEMLRNGQSSPPANAPTNLADSAQAITQGSGVVRADQNYAPDGRTYSTTPSGTPVYQDPNAGAISREPDRPGASNEKAVPLGQTAGPAAQSSLPRVSTPEEARKLPRGTRFITSDGREGIVP